MANKAPTDEAEDGTKVREESCDLADLGSLISLACSSEDHEAYRVVAASDHFRVGLVVIAAPDAPISLRIEVLLQILAKDTRPSIADLERMNNILENLTKRGYSMDHHDGCWVTCERAVVVDDFDNECLAVITTIRSEEGVRHEH